MRVISLEILEGWKLNCMFDNGEERALAARPLIERHLHIEGVSSLLEPETFGKAAVGSLGQVFWPDAATMADSNGTRIKCEYDMSPQFIWEHSQPAPEHL